MRNGFIIVAVIFCAVLSGCMHTVVGTGSVQSPDWAWEVWVRAHGASGKAFVDKTRKRVYVGITPTGTDADSKLAQIEEFRFTGAGLNQSILWTSSNEVQITFYDFGDGNHRYDRSGAPSNHLGTVWIRRNGESAWKFEPNFGKTRK